MLILASGSPRRKKFLEELGIDFKIIPSDEEETVPEGLTPEQTVEMLALKKAQNVLKRTGGEAVLAADSVVVYGGKIIGKPKDTADAVRILKTLSGKTHKVITGIAFLTGGKVYNEAVVSEVAFNRLTDDFICDYVAGGSPLDKAGAYGIQDGDIAAAYNGSYTNIIGLPMERVTEILKEEGYLPKENVKWR